MLIANDSFAEVQVDGLRELTPSVREIRIRPLQGAAAAHEPGAHLPVQLALADGRVALRHYSLVGAPDGLAYRIAVKRQDDGRGGSLAMWRLAPGDRLAAGQPRNHFPLDLQAPAYLLVAGGIGITPLVLMAERLARRGAPLRMLYAARSPQELAFAEELRAILGDRLRTFAGSLSQRIDLRAEIDALPARGQLYTCGPMPMLDAVRAAWQAARRAPADLRFETFGSGGREAASGFKVRLPRHGLAIDVPVGTSLLDALEASGVETLHDCRRGECGLCVMDVLAVDGRIDHRDVFLSDEEKQGNHRICACVSRVSGAITLDTAYRQDTLAA